MNYTKMTFYTKLSDNTLSGDIIGLTNDQGGAWVLAITVDFMVGVVTKAKLIKTLDIWARI